MPELNGTGPENEGKLTGRSQGKCKKERVSQVSENLGKGMGLRRKSTGGQGKGKRLKSGIK